MFAVIKTGGKQYRVEPNDVINVEKLVGEAGDSVEFDEILVIGEGSDAKIGAPLVENALVSAEIVKQMRTRKVIAFKKRRRQNSKRTRGHRQEMTTLRITNIALSGAKADAKPKKAADAPKAPAKKKAAPKTAAPESND